ncbi:hypothetical protein [Rhodopseudomonas palustris]|uniref:Uncharacterized protein n=1 Tax=Rhodopseudomonas palustris (strain BisB18) TaxID=316056 RepID=Q21AL6_RHOPB
MSLYTPYDAPTFNLAPVGGITPEQAKLLVRHVQELNIVGRYGGYFTEAHRRVLRLCDGMRASGQDVARGVQLFRDNAAMVSSNSWDHLFYSAVLDDPGFLDYLTNGDLPPIYDY